MRCSTLGSFGILLCGALAASLSAQDDRFASGSESVHDAGGSEERVPWKLLRPAKVEAGARYPLVLFLHGAGERGADNERQLVWFPRPMAGDAASAQFPCFVLAPQCPANARWMEVDWSAERSPR